MKKIRITFLCILDLQSASTIRLQNYAMELAKRGHKIDFLVPPSVKRKTDGINIHYISEIQKKPFRGISLMFSSLFSLLKIKKSDVLHFSKPLPVSGFPCILYKKMKDVPVVCDWDDIEGVMGFSKFRKFPEKDIISCFERWVPKHVDGVTTVSENLKKYASKYCKNVIKIPHLCLINKFNPNISGEGIREKYSLERKKVLMFTGGLGPSSDVHICIKAMKYVVKEHADTALVIVGEGVAKPRFEELVEKLELKDHVNFLKTVPFNLMPQCLAAADVLLLPMDGKWINNYYRLPIKMFDYMGMGKPIVAQNIGEIKILKNKAILTKPTVEDFSKGIIKALGNDKKMGVKIRKFAEKEFYSKQIKRLEKFYSKFT